MSKLRRPQRLLDKASLGGMLLFVESRGVSCLRTVSVLHSSREPHLLFHPQPPPPGQAPTSPSSTLNPHNTHSAHHEVEVQGRAPLRFVASRPVRMIFDLTWTPSSLSVYPEKRKNEAERIRQKYPDRIPVRSFIVKGVSALLMSRLPSL